MSSISTQTQLSWQDWPHGNALTFHSGGPGFKSWIPSFENVYHGVQTQSIDPHPPQPVETDPPQIEQSAEGLVSPHHLFFSRLESGIIY